MEPSIPIDNNDDQSLLLPLLVHNLPQGLVLQGTHAITVVVLGKPPATLADLAHNVAFVVRLLLDHDDLDVLQQFLVPGASGAGVETCGCFHAVGPECVPAPVAGLGAWSGLGRRVLFVGQFVIVFVGVHEDYHVFL
jgi:hypothetical protein